jgi:biopolymer transport protein ExbB
MFITYLQQGGWVVYIIVLLSVVALAVFIERMFYLRKVRTNAKIINEKMREKLKALRVDEAIAVCENHTGPASNIIKAGLEHYDKNRDDIERAMEDAAKYEIPKLNKSLPILGTIVSISTLLGLLGTVLGMITSSAVLSTQGMSNPSDLIGGIAQALITTAAGLIVAIPSLVGYNYLVAKIDNIISDIEIITTDLIQLLNKSKKEPGFNRW